jgi:nitroimidazol reductase NimA-like FMN-containing flavoprotein (pyridoxamine 5'-phosphate oxidase superfamily)
MEYDRHGLAVISRDQCLGLLGSLRIGRVVISLEALPAAFPVNFALMDDDVVFRTAPGTKLSAALDEAVVAFQADRFDAAACIGWSILIQGRASIITDPEELERARRLRIRPWLPSDRPHFVRIRSEVVSGRRLPADAELLALSRCERPRPPVRLAPIPAAASDR